MQVTLSISAFLLLIRHQRCDDLSDFPEISATDEVIKPRENFTELQIRGLRGPLRYETLYQLSTVSKLKILNNRITEIEPGAMCPSPSLHSLELNFAGNPHAPNLTKEAFKECQFQLKDLFLRFDFDNSSALDTDALEDLRLEVLSLQCYALGNLTRDFLKLQSVFLVKLVLCECRIWSIEIDAFEGMENLEDLEISYNRNLTHLPRDLFRNVSKLKSLNLKYNRIRELSWDEFEGLRFLEDLNLTGNRLAFFDLGKIYESMPNLRRLEMLKNLLPCKLKKAFAEDLEAKFNRSIEVVYSINGCRNRWNL